MFTLALLASAYAADRTPAYGSALFGLEPHWNTVHGWEESAIAASGEDLRFRHLATPFAKGFFVLPPLYAELNFGGLIGLLARPKLDPELGGERAAEFYDLDVFRFYLGPVLGSETFGVGLAVGYSAAGVGLTHTEISTSGFGNVLASGVGGKLVNYLVLDGVLGFHTHVGAEALDSQGGALFDGRSFTLDEYVMLAVGENFGFYVHPGYRSRTMLLSYDKDQPQRVSTYMIGAGIAIP